MRQFFAITVFSLLSLVTTLAHAQSQPPGTDDISLIEPNRPGYAMFRCCAKPATYPDTNCEQGVDKLQALGKAVYICEYKYGKGNCISSCRRLK